MEYYAIRIREENGELLVDDSWLLSIWKTIVLEDRVDLVFYSGGVDNPETFLEFIKSTQRSVSVVADKDSGQIHAMGWLTNWDSGTPFAHFCALGKPNRRVGRILTDHWLDWRDQHGNYKLRLVMGITPVNHSIALRLLKIAGFTHAGTVPDMCYCSQSGMYVPGVISYLQRDQGDP
ncbi:MAG: hypothetical protein RLZZ396_2567 [Planctomycetota bacterium]|jgi:hypothetical protein